MDLPKPDELDAAANAIYEVMPPTPQFSWPLLNQHVGTEVWVKHENHTPLGAFKIRGGIAYLRQLLQQRPFARAVIAASKGNHGQSVALAARAHGIRVAVVVPRGNSPEKNAAMVAAGAELIEHGDDFQDALNHAGLLAEQDHLHLVPSFDRALVCGVASYSMELFRAVADIDTLYVPIGLGSGICGAMAAREALRVKTEIVGVVASAAPAYALSFTAKTTHTAPVSATVADGLACRSPNTDALGAMLQGVTRIVVAPEEALRSAMRLLFAATHNVAEGAGAAALAALLIERDRMKGRRVAIVLSGGNADSDRFAQVLSEATGDA